MATKDLGTSGRRTSGSTKNRNAYCSFCRKSHRDVGPLVEGPAEVYICGECVELCQSIIDQEKRRRGVPRAKSTTSLPPAPSKKSSINTSSARLVPSESSLSLYIITTNASALVDGERSEVEIDKSNILLIGPTGSGKTLLAKTLARSLMFPSPSAMPPHLPKPATLVKMSKTCYSSSSTLLTSTSKQLSVASSISMKLTKSPKRTRTSASLVMSPAKAFSRLCSRCSKAQ